MSSERRIAEVVQETGVSKELVHHYLRLGLIPASEVRARYSDTQVRLLRQVRTLREDHNLPLETIRRIFEIFAFEPARLESLTLSESLCTRMTRLVSSGELIASETLTATELAEVAGIAAERLDEYVDANLVTALGQAGARRFSAHDAKAIALCEHGIELGMPFDSFRTIASYVRVGFELEYRQFFATATGEVEDGSELVGGLFLRTEIASAFVQNVLQSQLHAHVWAVLDQRSRPGWSVDDAIFGPSRAFVTRYGLQKRIDEAKAHLLLDPDDAARWSHAAALMLHAGQHREAAFFLEESLERWPADHQLAAACGRALILCGESDAGSVQLAHAAQGDGSAPLVRLYQALVRFQDSMEDDRPEALVADSATVRAWVNEALASAETAPAAIRTEVCMLGGWLLSALPPILSAYDLGRDLLIGTYHRLQAEPLADDRLPGLDQRYLINTAHLLMDCLRRGDTAPPPEARAPSIGALRTLICCTDPGSAFAERAFIERDDEDTPERFEP